MDWVSVNKMVAVLSYKPGWTFTVEHGWLCFTAEVIHSVTLQPVRFNVQRLIPRVALKDADTFLSWWMDILMEAEMHEIREFARYKGELVDDPHKTIPV